MKWGPRGQRVVAPSSGTEVTHEQRSANTSGASLVFLVAKTGLEDSLRRKAGPWLRRMEDGLRENALNYLLFPRMISVFPFGLVNLVPACLGVSFSTCVAATFLGGIPGSLVYAGAGNGLGAVFDAGNTPDLGIIFKPTIIFRSSGLHYSLACRWPARKSEAVKRSDWTPASVEAI